MSKPSNGGPSSHGTAARYSFANHYYSALLTHNDARQQLQELGFEYTDKLPASGNGRIPARGKGPRNTSTAVSWTDDGQALHWREFTTDDHGTIFSKTANTASRKDSAKLFRQAELRRRKAEAERQVLQVKIARQAQDRYRVGTTSGTHGYIITKQLSDLHNARIDECTSELLVPMWVSGVGLVNLQRIWEDGTKLFLKGGRVTGAYSIIGSLNGAKLILVCEGWATGASLYEQFGIPVVVAFNAGNLMPVCQALRSRFDNLSVVVASDDDRQNSTNTGRLKAIEAAESIGANLLFPELCMCCTCSDHADVAVCRRRCNRG